MTMEATMEKETMETGGRVEPMANVFSDVVAGTEKVAEEPTIISLDDAKELVTDFLTNTTDARADAERCRDYYDGKQWTEEQIQQLKQRKQAPIVNNRIKVKLNGLLGLVSVRKGDPKAYPRNQNKADDGASEAATDGLRYVADVCQFDMLRNEVASNFFCEGYGGVHIIEDELPNGDIEVCIEVLRWDRIIFDPYSQKSDFSDARYKGFGVWMDEEDILSTPAYEGVTAEMLGSSTEVDTDTTMEDKPRWYRSDGKRKRYFVITLYFKKKGTWHQAIFTGGCFLTEPHESIYLDKYGRPECPIEIQHAYIDRDNNRYGELKSFLDLQDEINHRRSKALFLLSQRQTFGNRGAIPDIKKAKKELAKPDGHLETGQGEFGKDFGILPTGDMAQGQFELLQEAKQEIDAQSYNAQNAGDRQQGDLSGVAIGKLQSAGITELNLLFESLTAWELRVYKQAWCRIRQFWTQEKWVRVTDDEELPRFVGFNVPITMEKFLNETMDDDSLPHEMRLGASAQLIQLEQQNPEALQQLIEVKNKPAELDMDIILDQSFDAINVSQEQLDAILKFGAGAQFDVVDLLEISNITGKDKLIEKIEARRKEAASGGPDPQSVYLTSKAAEAEASAEVKKQDAQQTALETQMLQNQPMVPFKGTVSA